MTDSITLRQSPALQYVLRLADTCLIHSHRLSEWCGHAPALEEDIAMANMALDMLGQARALLTHAATLEGSGKTEDQLAYLRDERDFFNATMVELPNHVGQSGGTRANFAFTVLRNHAVATWLRLMWERLLSSQDRVLAAVAAKAVKEARYHEQHAADWVVRLGDGTDDSAQRMRAANLALWPYVAELFAHDAVDDAAVAAALGPAWRDLQTDWLAAVDAVHAEAHLARPNQGAFMSTGRVGRHSEHMGYILTEMQHLQRSFPGGVW